MFRHLVLFALSLLMAAPSFAADKKEIEGIIKNYIEAHPEVIDNAMQKYYMAKRKEQEETQFRQSLKNRLNVPVDGSPVKGSVSAPVTVVEFSDFQCPYCARSVAIIGALGKKYGDKIRFVFKHYPLERIHPVARSAAKAAMAAGEQGKFWQFHDTLMAKQLEWKKGDANKHYARYAKQLGINGEKFGKDMKTPAYEKKINSDIALGKKLGVQSTPTFFVNGVMVRGARDVGYFARVIDYLLVEKSKAKAK
ncbi:Periplasmic thiol:disulfide interchange protein DsbA [hydrothermal vent metagenome]|uniref:Periplasmic thiol:disulfide interchange protein DsbA n=1 Tax=hydrothermal vent metagenome TaxID=652676 RepID=A0A3B1CE51_9ZZZZ